MQLKEKEDRYILESALPHLRAKIDKINERLSSAKVPLIEMTVGEPHTRRFQSGMFSGSLPVVKVELSRAVGSTLGEVKVLALSKIDNKTEFMEHKTFTKLTPEQDEKIRMPEAPCLCEHCNKNQRRVYIFSLETPEGIKRVGSGCVESYTGFDFKTWHSALEKAVEALDKYVEVDFNTLQAHTVLPVDPFMCEVVQQIAEHGYMTKADHGISTGQVSFTELSQNLDAFDAGEYTYPQETIDRVEKVKDFFYATEYDPATRDIDYYSNLRALMQFGHLSRMQASLLGSAVVHYNSQMAKKATVKAGQELGNEFFGTVKDRIPLKNLRVDNVWPDYGLYGLTTKITMYDDKNRMFVWKASGGVDVKAGDIVHLVGTISKHETWYYKKLDKDMHENSLQRCKFHTLEEIDELIKAANSPAPKRKARAKEQESQPSL